ncbi:WecB/TagA/CpsF family glycosyltransferase [Litoribacter ruber]|uniref:WecB/TagA/CpsF family glycosyltransferase n=1 Tax=Litoribacter ruber TaxID=702568 RepID=UPI001BDB6C8A|nr:WecB/TagA/CpsF family glycosyltransferase [Litoribacter ruber]MBT0812312.1 WecB/TagA/CpsF family glycosyltransferase [Litoribacter ruber]
MEGKFIKILGLDFFNGQVQEVIAALKSGGLLVVPSGPGLATINSETEYYRSLQAADLVIADSGYMTLLWNLTHEQKINRISGLEFLQQFLADEEVKHSEFLLVNPSKKEADANQDYLNKKGFKLTTDNSYIAPIYPKDRIEDENLLNLLEEKKPRYVLINLGGGVQEILGAYLKGNLSYRPAIICTGAAIAFLTGEQAQVPTWADRLFLGWLVRCINKPKVYIPRYACAFKLLTVMVQYKTHYT